MTSCSETNPGRSHTMELLWSSNGSWLIVVGFMPFTAVSRLIDGIVRVCGIWIILGTKITGSISGGR